MPSFESAWHQPDFELPEQDLQLCVFATRFNTFVQELVADVLQHPSEFNINIAKLRLLDRYFAFYVSVPKPHQNHVGNRGGHTCLFQVLERGYNALRILELSASPPKILPPAPPTPPPPPPPPPPPLQISGIFLGEDDS